MRYPHEQQVKRWLEEHARWSPQLGVGSGSIWDRVRSSAVYHAAPIPVMGGEAADTQAALQRLPEVERRALDLYHLRPGYVARKAKLMRRSVREFQALLHRAHSNFYELRWEICTKARSVSDRNREVAAGAIVKRLAGIRRW